MYLSHSIIHEKLKKKMKNFHKIIKHLPVTEEKILFRAIII